MEANSASTNKPEMKAGVASVVLLGVNVEGRVYNLLIPNGVSYQEVMMVCGEMSKLIEDLQKQAVEKEAQKAAEEASKLNKEEVIPEVVL